MGMLKECPWTILHSGHVAWYQRALMRGDFAPGAPPVGWYVVYPDGCAADPYAKVVCATCGEEEPKVETLIPVETATGRRNFLRNCREGRESWPPRTSPNTCWWCNSPKTVSGRPPLCVGCAEHLRRY